MESAIRTHMNSQKSLRNDTGLDNYHNNVDAQSVFSNPLDYSINEQWERYKTSEKNSQEQIVTNNRYDPIKSYPLPKTEPSTGIIRNDFRTPLTSDYIEPVSEDRAVFVDNHENSGSYLPQSTMTTIQQKSPPREKAPDEDRYVRVTGGDYPIFVKKQEPAYQPSTTFQNTNNSFRTNATSRPTIEQDPFIKRMNELRGVYDDMKRNIKTGQQDPTNNYFVNIKKPDKQLEPERSRAETLQDNIIITPIAQTLPLTPNPQINPDPSQASLITISNQPTKRDSNPKVPNLPPLKDKIKMITSGGAGSRKSSASNKPPITKKMSRSVLEEKRSSERLSSNEGSQTLLHIKPQRQTFGKEGLPPSDRRPMVKRPDPREVKERYTMKVTPAPPTHSRKTSKVGDIILLNDMNLSSHGDQNMTYDGALSKDSLLNQDSFMLKDPSFAEQRTKRPLMPIKVRSKSALKVLKEVSPDEKFEYDESYIKLCENLGRMIQNFNSLKTSNDMEIGINNLVNEFRKQNSFFVKLSQYTGTEILKNCNIIVLKNQNIYSEHEYNPNAYIILYGAVYLKNKALGLFKQCLLGESIAEESVLERNYNKQETARVVDETAVLEITATFMERLKATLKSSYPSDYMILTGIMKKNLLQKKSLRALGTLKI